MPFIPINTHLTATFAPMQWHALVLATFASLIAPFGGFFASGLKRSFKIKDFGDSIPGHGGMTDRMDCQFIMGFFAYLYYHSFIATYEVKLGTVLEMAISLTDDEKIELVRGMGRYLSNQGIVTEEVRDSSCRSASCLKTNPINSSSNASTKPRTNDETKNVPSHVTYQTPRHSLYFLLSSSLFPPHPPPLRRQVSSSLNFYRLIGYRRDNNKD